MSGYSMIPLFDIDPTEFDLLAKMVQNQKNVVRMDGSTLQSFWSSLINSQFLS